MSLGTPTLVVHTNTYVTLVEADEYVNNTYLSTTPEYQSWFGGKYEEPDKVRALIASQEAINKLKFKGRKARAGQHLAFPRRNVTGFGYAPLLFISQTHDNTLVDGAFGQSDGLDSAKTAQIVNAVAMLSLDTNIVRDVTERLASGIKSRKMASVSEDYTGSEARSTSLMQGLYAKDLVEYHLNSWLVKSVHSL